MPDYTRVEFSPDVELDVTARGFDREDVLSEAVASVRSLVDVLLEGEEEKVLTEEHFPIFHSLLYGAKGSAVRVRNGPISVCGTTGEDMPTQYALMPRVDGEDVVWTLRLLDIEEIVIEEGPFKGKILMMPKLRPELTRQ